MNYVVVGTDHDRQKSDSQDKGLQGLLKSIVETNHVVLIAEEVKTSEDVQTFGRQLVGEGKWLSIDMTAQERKDTGIYDVLRSGTGPVYDPVEGQDVRANPYHKRSEGIREVFWLAKIQGWCKGAGISEGTVVITCGHNHLEFLAEKIKRQGHTVTKQEYLPYDKQALHGVFTLYDD